MRPILLAATTNVGKLRDLALAADREASIVPLPRLGSIAAPDEDQDTYEGNATLKAVYYSKFAPGQVLIADDSGLEVDALDGAPGIRSARYAEDSNYLADSGLTIDERNNRCLLAALDGLPKDERKARYRCVLAATLNGRVLAIGKGMVEGIILPAARGNGGFGYDPYFAPRGWALSMAELEPETRTKVSHRARALRDLLPKLRVAMRSLTR